MELKINENKMPIIYKMIEEIALYTLSEFVKATSVEEFKELKKNQLEEELEK